MSKSQEKEQTLDELVTLLRTTPRDQLSDREREYLDDNEAANVGLSRLNDQLRAVEAERARLIAVCDYTMDKAVQHYKARTAKPR